MMPLYKGGGGGKYNVAYPIVILHYELFPVEVS